MYRDVLRPQDENTPFNPLSPYAVIVHVLTESSVCLLYEGKYGIFQPRVGIKRKRICYEKNHITASKNENIKRLAENRIKLVRDGVFFRLCSMNDQN